MTSSFSTFFIIAGENSGDCLGADLIEALRRKTPEVTILGMGGDKMRQAGAHIVLDMNALSIIGGLQVVTHYPRIVHAFKVIKKALLETRPDLLILIDYPGFNLRMAKFAKKHGIPVLYYVSPQLWAWHYSRINTIKQYVDHMAVFFPFEKMLYEREGVPVQLIRHPLLHQISAHSSVANNYKHPLIGLLPGSRKQEIEKMLPVMVEAKKHIQRQLPQAEFVLFLSSNLSLKDLVPYITPDIRIIQRDHDQVLASCQAAMVTSGTATLEVALHTVPLVVMYRVFGYNLAKRFIIKTPFIGLCNIVAEEEVAKEMIQNRMTPASIANEVVMLASNESYRKKRLAQLQRIRTHMEGGERIDALAEKAFELIGN
ncbi:MAG TPA: lipid-A-disaccharide synthase [Coxiellaceae bacterium]|nr:lipid-A-disaccharide synthase [Coxiellaceae bacterium]